VTWATVIHMNMGETRALARAASVDEVKQVARQFPEEFRDYAIVHAKSSISFLSMSALDALMKQFGDARLGVKKDRKEVIVKNWLSWFDPSNHDARTGKLIHAYEDEVMSTTLTPDPNAEREATDVVEGESETATETTTNDGEQSTGDTGGETSPETGSGEDPSSELAEVVKRIAKKKRAAAETEDNSTSTAGDNVATKKTAKKKAPAKKKVAASKVKLAAPVVIKKKATGNGAKKGFPYPVPDPETKCGKVLAFLNEQIKKKDIAENEKAEKAELFEQASKKFETKVITIRTYASDHRDKLKWRAARKKAT
jgi:hypothetical protein